MSMFAPAMDNLLAAAPFMPHGTCYLWKPGLVGLHLVSNAIIALSYLSIPITLIYILRKRAEVPFDWLLALFAAFIIFCGLGHGMDIWTLWHPNYWLSGTIRAITALVSLGTAVALVALAPPIVAFPSLRQIEETNRLLLEEIQERKRVESALNQEQQFLQALLANLSDGIVACNEAGELTLFNRATQKLHGLPLEPVPADRWGEHYSLYHPDGKTPLNTEEIPLYRALQGETVRDVEMTVIPKEGKTRTLLASGGAIVTPEGEKLGAVVAMRDITQRKQAEAALRKSEERWQLALLGTGDGIFDWNIVTGEAIMSPRLKEMLGYEDSEVENTYEGWRKLVHPEDIDRVVKSVQAHLHRETPKYTAEYRMRCKGGNYKWVLVRGQAKWDDAGNPLRMVGSHQDITQRKQAEVQLRETLERYQLLAENSSDLIATQTLDGSLLYVSPACRHLLGYEPKELIGRSLFEFLHPEDAAALQKTRALVQCLPEQYTQSYRMRRRDGTYIWLEAANKISPSLDNENQPIVVSLARDITERKQAEVAVVALNQELEEELAEGKSKLKAISRLYRSVVNSVKEVIFQTDKTGRWTFLSPAWMEITGFSLEESLNTPLIDYIYSTKDKQFILSLFQDVMALRRDSFRYEFRTPIKTSGFRWLEIYARVERSEEGNVLGTYGTLNDVSDRKQAEVVLKARAEELAKQRRQIELQNLQLQEASRLKSEFLATMSHELRTPLNAIMGFSQMLQLQQYGSLASRQLDMVDRIFNNSQNLLTMLNEVLDFSKLEAGVLQLVPKPLDVVKSVRLTVEELRSLAQTKHLTLQVHCHLDDPQVVNDPECLRRILVNLLSNAIKFTETGGITVEVKEVTPDRLAISVADTGIGIPSDRLEVIFEAFRQVDQTLTRKHAGTGLGLAITKSLVEMMGGTIVAKSQEGEGSIFRFEFPRRVEA